MGKKSLRNLGIILLAIGGFLFAFLGFISMWGDLEAMFFNATIRSEKPLSALRCPAVITQNEDAAVSARIHNPSDRELDMQIRTFVSDGFVVLMKQFTSQFTLGPGESKTVYVPIAVEDAAYNRFVLVRMHQISRGPLPYLNAACGVFVFNLPVLTGTQFIILILGLGSLIMAAGMALWTIHAKPVIGGRYMTLRLLIMFMIASILLAVTGLLGWWVLALGLTVIWILLVSQYAFTPRMES